MKAIIFAGGVGSRLWPVSRKASPKQFEKIIGNKSTLQLAVARLLPAFSYNDIYISTGLQYVSTIKKQLPKIPKKNIIGEPAKRDVGPAVSLAIGLLNKTFPDTPVVILWSDHLVKKEKEFKKVIKAAGSLVQKEKNKIVFIGQKPRFASENLGWIKFGDSIKNEGDVAFYEFLGFKYRPSIEIANEYFNKKSYSWNLGYFVSTPRFINDQYKKFAPNIEAISNKIVSASDEDFEQTLAREYEKMPEINFDNAIIEKLDPKSAYVINEDIGWSDVGAWEALKDALQVSPEDNVTYGNVLLEECLDNLIYNYEGKKLVVGIDLNEHIIINTKDVLLVAKKASASKVKKLVQKLENSENNNLI